MKVEIEGKVFVADEDDINTDVIIPARYLNTSNPEELAKYAMEDLDPKKHPTPFLNKDKTCDYRIIVSGKNFGCGSSREHAVWALSAAGIEAVVAPVPVTFARIFYRNCINSGMLYPLESEKRLVHELKTGEVVTISLSEDGSVLRTENGLEYDLRSFSGIAREILEAGGLTPYNKKRLASTKQP